MPRTTIHFLAAEKLNPNAGIDFHIGNIAPDAIRKENQKIAFHFRDAADRQQALKEFALKAGSQNEYLKGIIFHLFVDWKWDTMMVPKFAEKHGDNWNQKYIEETLLAVICTFRNNEWISDILKQMEVWDTSSYVETDYITPKDIGMFVKGWRKGLQSAKQTEISSEFSPLVIERFMNDTVEEFNVWYSSLISI
jgi:hypothetical protein